MAETGVLELEQAQDLRQRRRWLPRGRVDILTPKFCRGRERTEGPGLKEERL